MPKLTELIPDVDVLLSIDTEELAIKILEVLAEEKNTVMGLFQLQNFCGSIYSPFGQDNLYPDSKRQDILDAVAEGWNWLVLQGLLVPDSGLNGTHGFMKLTRKAYKLLKTGKFNEYRRATLFPKTLLHPIIADEVWLELARGDFDSAVFKAFKAVEIAVRKAAGFENTEYGVEMVRKAFHPKGGVLTNQTSPSGEKDALMHLFAGAIGSYKNPHSHRTVGLQDMVEAQEMVMLASHLLRIVDERGAVNQK